MARVALVMPHTDPKAGGPRQALELASWATRAGHALRVLTPADSPDADEFVIPYSEINDEKWFRRADALMYWEWLHFHPSQTVASTAATRRGLTITSWIQKSLALAAPWMSVFVTGLGVDPHRIRWLALEREPDTVGIVAHPHWQRGLELGVATLNELRKRRKVRVIGFGRWPLNSDLFDEYHVAPDDTTVTELYNRAWVWFYPSLVDGFGLPQLEAAACGAHVVSFNNSGVQDILAGPAPHPRVEYQFRPDSAAHLLSLMLDAPSPPLPGRDWWSHWSYAAMWHRIEGALRFWQSGEGMLNLETT